MSIWDIARALPDDVKDPVSRVFRMVPPGIRYGRTFRQVRQHLAETEGWSATALEEYQARELRRIVGHVFANVPFYGREFARRGLTPADIVSSADLAKLPRLDKETIRENIGDLVARNFPRSRIYRESTGATTGLPMWIYGEKSLGPAREWAFVWRGWNWAGYRHGDRRAVLRGNRLPGRCSTMPWGLDPIHNEFVVSALDLTPEVFPAIVSKMDRLKVTCLQAYPSALHLLTEWLRLHDVKIPSLRIGLTSSETLYPKQREQAKSLLDMTIYDHYGNSERSALIMQCERGTYHMIPEYGIIELLDQDGKPVGAGETGEIVATGFTNPVMPLVRHRTGDFAVRSLRLCPCGRNFPAVERIVGRVHEFFVSEGGALISSIWSDEAIWECRNRIRAYQFVQDEPGRLTLRIERRERMTPEDEVVVRRRFADLYPTLEMEIRYAEHIPRTGRGKFRYLVQNLPVTKMEQGMVTAPLEVD